MADGHSGPGTTSKHRNNDSKSHKGEINEQSCILPACATAPVLNPHYCWHHLTPETAGSRQEEPWLATSTDPLPSPRGTSRAIRTSRQLAGSNLIL